VNDLTTVPGPAPAPEGSLPPRDFTLLEGVSLSILLALTGTFLVGYRFGDSNHGITVPILKRFMDRSLYPGDVMVATAERFPTVFYRALAALLPGTAFFLGLPYAPARTFLATGARVALASDFNPGSSMGLNLQLTMTMAVSQMKMSPEEALLGVTLHGAYAMGLETGLGSLAPGKQCDLLLADVPNWRYLSYFYGVNHVSRVIKRGRLVHER